MKPEDQILQLARQQGLSVYFNARERASGKSWIKFSIRNGQTLAEFSNATAALAWFPKSLDDSHRRADFHSVA